MRDTLRHGGQTVRLRFTAVNDFSEITSFRIDDVTVTGTTATAKVTARRGTDKNASTTYSLVREGGAWRLSDLGAS